MTASSVPPAVATEALVGPRRDGETFGQFQARYSEFNRRVAARLSFQPSRSLPTINVRANVTCSICGRKGPDGFTIDEAARLAQVEGFWRNNARAVWFCPEHVTGKGGAR